MSVRKDFFLDMEIIYAQKLNFALDLKMKILVFFADQIIV